MRTLTTLLNVVSILLITHMPAHGQNAPPTMADFDFLKGYWQGTGFGGRSEEIWMPAADGSMFGIFKQASDAGITFTEFMEITQVGENFVLRLKHFNPDFTGWEAQDEYVTFTLRSVAPNKAVFGGLTYTRIDSTNLRIELRLQESDGNVHTEVFDLVKVDI